MQLWGLLWGPLPQTSQFRHPAHCQALRATAARDGLEVQWQEHELGSYPTIVLLWERRHARNTVELSRKVSGGAYGLRKWSRTSSRLVDDARLFGSGVSQYSLRS